VGSQEERELTNPQLQENEARTFTINKTRGEVNFVEGNYGEVPAGNENIKASYRTGGGTTCTNDNPCIKVFSSKGALTALQIAVGKLSYSAGFDVNNDGKVDSEDAREILKIAVEGTEHEQN
jgi:hypothetical protein